jgi:hypothetical protein
MAPLLEPAAISSEKKRTSIEKLAKALCVATKDIALQYCVIRKKMKKGD